MNKIESPKVSVILTSFNHEKYIRESIECVLNQTFVNFELIIFDDFSADKSWEIINSYSDTRIKKYRNFENQGPVYGINKAIFEIAKGEYIAIHHSDDIWEPEKLQKQVDFLNKNQDMGAVFTNAHIIGEESEPFVDESHFYYKIFDQPNRTRHEWLRYFFEKGNALCHPSVLIRKQCYMDCGLYRYGFAQLGDFDMWVRLALRYDIHVLPEKLVRFRVRAGEANASGNRPDTRSRGAYEYSLILNHYLKIDRLDDLIKVFPEAHKFCDGQNPNLKYALAMTAIEIRPHHFTITFALNLLSEILNHPTESSLTPFNSQDFIKLTGELDPVRVYEFEELNLKRIESKKLMSSIFLKYTALLVKRLKNFTMFIAAYLIVSGQSAMMRLKVFGKSSIFHFAQPYHSQKILLLALYQKGHLRPDIENLLVTAKKLGMYVLAINTLKVHKPNSLKEKIDCYIERPNFGRDFGSYKTGFLHLFKQGWDKQCPRLLMLNDSMFYSKQNLAAFLNQMTNTDIEVLGATENHDAEHHLGSFCISLQASVLQQPHFKNFWKHYTNTDIRPKIIKLGEMKLTKTLRSCVSSADQLQAFYNLNWLLNYLDNNKELLDRVYDLYRDVDFFHWKRPSLQAVSKRIYYKYIHFDYNSANINFKLTHFVDNPKQLIKAIEKDFKETNLQNLSQLVYEEVKNDLIECFVMGSQIHQNGILLHHLGMPIIKLDGLYRGLFSIKDVVKLANQLSQSERTSFKKLMFDKPFGGNTLFGWKRAAFYRHLI